jgi:hypothetical protein
MDARLALLAEQCGAGGILGDVPRVFPCVWRAHRSPTTPGPVLALAGGDDRRQVPSSRWSPARIRRIRRSRLACGSGPTPLASFGGRHKALPIIFAEGADFRSDPISSPQPA